MEIKEIIKSERLKHKLTQEQIAKALNISRPAYSMYETGANIPPVDVLIRMANYYNVSIDYLVGRYKQEE